MAAEKLDEKELVTFKEMLMANSILASVVKEILKCSEPQAFGCRGRREETPFIDPSITVVIRAIVTNLCYRPYVSLRDAPEDGFGLGHEAPFISLLSSSLAPQR